VPKGDCNLKPAAFGTANFFIYNGINKGGPTPYAFKRSNRIVCAPLKMACSDLATSAQKLSVIPAIPKIAQDPDGRVQ
jgi:hypothetical protein